MESQEWRSGAFLITAATLGMAAIVAVAGVGLRAFGPDYEDGLPPRHLSLPQGAGPKAVGAKFGGARLPPAPRIGPDGLPLPPDLPGDEDLPEGPEDGQNKTKESDADKEPKDKPSGAEPSADKVPNKKPGEYHN